MTGSTVLFLVRFTSHCVIRGEESDSKELYSKPSKPKRFKSEEQRVPASEGAKPGQQHHRHDDRSHRQDNGDRRRDHNDRRHDDRDDGSWHGHRARARENGQTSSLHKSQQHEGGSLTKKAPSSHQQQQQQQQLDRESCWLTSNLRVKMVDRQYRKGRYYNTKVSG